MELEWICNMHQLWIENSEYLLDSYIYITHIYASATALKFIFTSSNQHAVTIHINQFFLDTYLPFNLESKPCSY